MSRLLSKLIGGVRLADGWTYVRLAEDVTSTTTVVANVPGMSFVPEANAQYEIQGMLMMRTDTATTGPRPGFGWPTGTTDGVGRIDYASSSSGNTPGMGNPGSAVQSAGTGATTTTGSWPALLWATFTTGPTPGSSFRLQLAAELEATGTVTMRAGSFIRYRRIA